MDLLPDKEQRWAEQIHQQLRSTRVKLRLGKSPTLAQNSLTLPHAAQKYQGNTQVVQTSLYLI